MKLSSILVLLALCGCTLLPIPVPVTTTAFMEEKQPPPKVEVTSATIPYRSKTGGIAMWSAEPTWGKVKRKIVSDGYYLERASTNYPVTQVFVTGTLSGRECRWSLHRLKEYRTTRDPSDFDVRAGRWTVGFTTDEVNSQFKVDCEVIRSMVAGDPAYADAEKHWR